MGGYVIFRVSTNLREQISRRDFEINPGDICIASAGYVMNRIYFCDVVWLNIHRVPKKEATKLLAITFSNLNRF